MSLGGFARIVAAAAVVTLAACSGSGAVHPPSSAAKTSSRPTPSAGARTSSVELDDAQRAAQAGYVKYVQVLETAERAPGPTRFETLKQVAVDPILGETVKSITQLQVYGFAYRGTPPVPRLSATSPLLKVAAGFRVTFSDCPLVERSWRIYSNKTGRAAPLPRSKVPPPYRSLVTMVLDNGHWKISSSRPDETLTCVP